MFGPLEEKREIIVEGEASSWLKKLRFLPNPNTLNDSRNDKRSCDFLERFTLVSCDTGAEMIIYTICIVEEQKRIVPYESYLVSHDTYYHAR